MKNYQRDRRKISLILALLLIIQTVKPVEAKTKEESTPRVRRMSLLSQLAEEEEQRDLIVGGKEASPGDFPYYVHLLKCGGSLISSRVVLTAAHCGGFNNTKVYVGCHEYGKATGDAVVRRVVDQVIHPSYDSSNYWHDFNLLLLDEPTTMDHTDIVLTLNEDDLIPADGQEVVVLGLGLIEESGDSPEKVRFVEVEKTADDYCNSAYGGDIEDSIQLCAGVEGGGKDACQGDSGGPLVVIYGNEHIQVGVVSSGTGCAQPEYPGIYARVSGEMDWIRSIVCDEWGQTDASFCPTARTGRSFGKPRVYAPEWFRIQSKHAMGDGVHYCLALEHGFVATNGEAIIMLPCDGTYQQQWTQFDNDYLVRSKMNPNKCASMTSTGELELYDCFQDDHATPFEAYSDGTIRLKDDSSQCLECSMGEYSMQERSMEVHKTILTDCSSTIQQQWKTTFRSDDFSRTKAAVQDVLESKSAEDEKGVREDNSSSVTAKHDEPTHVPHEPRDDSATTFETKHAEHEDTRDSTANEGRDEDGTWFHLKNAKTDTCLTLNDTTDLTVIVLQACDGSSEGQLWGLTETGELESKLDTTKCVVPSGDGSLGSALVVYPCSEENMFGEWEMSAFDDEEDPVGPIVSKEDPSKCLGSHASDSVVTLAHCPEDEDHIRDDRLWELV